MISRVNSENSSCARKIDEVFQHYGLKPTRFDIIYRDGSGNQYMYSSDETFTTSIAEADEQPVFSLLSTASETAQSFNTFGGAISQQFVDDRQIIADMRNGLAQDNVILLSASVSSEEPPCVVSFTEEGYSYGP